MANADRELTGTCACGKVAMTGRGSPIVSNICYCADCQKGSERLAALPGSAPVADADGGTPYILYREDRFEWDGGDARLIAEKIDGGSATNRMVASCCNSAMFMNFDDGRHWVAAYRKRFHGELPPVEMRICTKAKRDGGGLPGDLPSYPGYPLRFVARLIAAWLPMLVAGSKNKRQRDRERVLAG